MSKYAAESERLWLQSLTEDHFEDYHELMTNEKAKAWSHRPISTREESYARAIEAIPTPEHPWKGAWVIILRPEFNHGKQKIVGSIGLPRPGEIGYRIHPDFWGKGYMTEAVGLFVGCKSFDKLEAGADSRNAGSMRVLEKSGFSKGEYKKEFYDYGPERGGMSDLQMFYVMRPGK